MAEYYLTYMDIADGPEIEGRGNGGSSSYLPMTWNRAYAAPTHWRHLALDAKTWGKEISNEAYAQGVERLKITREELHRRLARRWGIAAEMNRKGATFVQRALAAEPRPESVDDLRFLQTSFRVYQPLMESLEQFHSALRQHFGGKADAQSRAALHKALAKAKEAQRLADESFPKPVDPLGGEVGALRTSARRLVESVEMWMAN
jgi:hypothetical protein